MSGETLAPSVKQRDTADCDTPASRATSTAVVRLRIAGLGIAFGILVSGLLARRVAVTWEAEP
ncbi:anti-sigma factor RsiW [Azospirillum agricola]|nr:anti-sigma factor RsiW [Azospirillum agricola]